MHMVNIHQAKTNLSKLVSLALQGEEVILCKAGQPMARLSPYIPESKARQPGLWKGRVTLSEDFDVLPEAFIAVFQSKDS